MAMDRSLWSGHYEPSAFPSFPCPTCNPGKLRTSGQPEVQEPAYSVSGRASSDWDIEWDEERFSLTLICDNAKCGEIAIVSGATTWGEQFDEEDGRWTYHRLLNPRTFFPAPTLIGIPAEAPREVTANIKLASLHFWSDMGAAANRLRASAEALLDFMEVPRTTTKENGDEVYLDLNRRIQRFKQTSEYHAPSLDALRLIGNLGSHGAEVSREALLDAFEVYEYTVEELCGTRKERIEQLRQKIIDSKAKYQ